MCEKYVAMWKKIMTSLFGGIGILIFIYLTWYAFRYSYEFTLKYDETAVDVRDSVLLHLFSFLLFLFMVRFLPSFILRKEAHVIRNVRILLIASMILSFCVALFWVHVTPCVPCADQASILTALEEIRNGVYSTFHADGYLGTVHFQMGLVTVFQWIFFITGSNAYQVLQTANAVCVPFILLAGYGILGTITENKAIQIVYCICMPFCLPLLFFTPFVYGEIFSVLFGFYMLWMVLLSLKTKKRYYLFPAGIFSVLGIFTKGSNWILVIAVVMICVAYSVRRKSLFTLLIAVIVAVSPFCANVMQQQYYEKVSGNQLTEGIPSTAWVAMGLHAAGERRGGWYDGYNFDTYRENGFSAEKTQAASVATIHERLRELLSGADNPRLFFHNKILSQWNAPDYESLASNSNFGSQPSAFVTAVYSGKLHFWLEGFMNEYQWLVYLGMLFGFVTVLRRKDAFYQLLVPLTVIGGFFFSLIWEAKTRYTFPFFLYMIPFAVYGWYWFTEWLQKRLQKKRKG